MRDSNRHISPTVVAKYVVRFDISNAAGQMPARRPSVAKHQLDALVVLVKRGPEQRVVELLRLRADLGIVDFERSAPTRVATSELVERLRVRPRRAQGGQRANSFR
jgi:hypothetical protein